MPNNELLSTIYKSKVLTWYKENAHNLHPNSLSELLEYINKYYPHIERKLLKKARHEAKKISMN